MSCFCTTTDDDIVLRHSSLFSDDCNIHLSKPKKKTRLAKLILSPSLFCVVICVIFLSVIISMVLLGVIIQNIASSINKDDRLIYEIKGSGPIPSHAEAAYFPAPQAENSPSGAEFTGDSTMSVTRIGNPAFDNCIRWRGRSEVRKGVTGEYGACIFQNGSECEEWELLRGECRPDDNRGSKLSSIIEGTYESKLGVMDTINCFCNGGLIRSMHHANGDSKEEIIPVCNPHGHQVIECTQIMANGKFVTDYPPIEPSSPCPKTKFTYLILKDFLCT